MRFVQRLTSCSVRQACTLVPVDEALPAIGSYLQTLQGRPAGFIQYAAHWGSKRVPPVRTSRGRADLGPATEQTPPGAFDKGSIATIKYSCPSIVRSTIEFKVGNWERISKAKHKQPVQVKCKSCVWGLRGVAPCNLPPHLTTTEECLHTLEHEYPDIGLGLGSDDDRLDTQPVSTKTNYSNFWSKVVARIRGRKAHRG
jgi:hypothetical protein